MSVALHRLLLLEDDYEMMRDLKEYIEEEMSWEVELTANYKILDRLAHEKFDLLMIDLMIRPTSPDAEGQPVENVHFAGVNWQTTGLEFLRLLRLGKFQCELGVGTSPQVPVLIVSAVAGYSVKNHLGKDVPFDGFVEKPFRLEELRDRLRRLIKE
jgi:CheY-like chemotaxis protein